MTKNNTDNPLLLKEYQARINRVMDHVESNIALDFTLEGLSRIAGFSKFHFNRIFHFTTGESLFSFIQRVRVEKAAALLLNNRSKSITNIAFDCGFSSSAAFSRSFKNRFSMSASQWRKSGREFIDVGADRLPVTEVVVCDSVEPESVDIKVLEARTLAYVRHTGPYEGDEELFVRLFDKLFQWAVPRELVVPGAAESFVLYHDSIDITDSDRLRISACIEVPEATRVDGEVGKMPLAGGKYVCARFRLDATEYAGAWCWVFNRFFPSSGFQPDDGFSFESYPVQDGDSDQGKTLVDICVPVKPL